ncbi:kinocilin [Scleropages formosus]|uniref:kinocilin n=1 Tax=Scleropages formosus TaxID=113540 RepID=UPI000878B8B5|nr:kinocilin [Scleropages formosus]
MEVEAQRRLEWEPGLLCRRSFLGPGHGGPAAEAGAHCSWMNAVSIGEYHGLRVCSALLSIVAGCIIIGVSRECDVDAVGGIFLGAGGLGLLISVYPFIRAWLNFNHILPSLGNVRVHPMAPNLAAEQPVEAMKREATQSQLNLERSKSRMGTFQETMGAEASPEEGPSSDVPDIIARRKVKQPSPDRDNP